MKRGKVKLVCVRVNKEDGLFPVPRWDCHVPPDKYVTSSMNAGYLLPGMLGLPDKARHGERWTIHSAARRQAKKRNKKET